MTVAVIATNRGQRSGASTTTRLSPIVSTIDAGSSAASVNGRPNAAAISRATPVMPIASGRLGVIARWNTTSSSPSTSRTSAPSGASAARARIPPWSSPRPSSRGEHSMPSDTTPRILRRSILKSPGSTAPTPRERHDHAGLDVRRAADNAQLPVAEVDVGEPDAVGVGMRHDVEDLRDDHAVDLAPRLVDLLDLEAELVQRVGDVGRRGLDRRELADPRQRGPHQNCLRKRTSPSHKFFTWSTPYRS